MTLITGNKMRNKSGYTFLELMVTVSILSIGIVGVFQALLISLDYQKELSRRLHAVTVFEHELALLENEYRYAAEVSHSGERKQIEEVLDHRHVLFSLDLTAGFIENLEGLLPVEMALSWNDRNRTISLKRHTYLVNFNIKPSSDASVPKKR